MLKGERKGAIQRVIEEWKGPFEKNSQKIADKHMFINSIDVE